MSASHARTRTGDPLPVQQGEPASHDLADLKVPARCEEGMTAGQMDQRTARTGRAHRRRAQGTLARTQAHHVQLSWSNSLKRVSPWLSSVPHHRDAEHEGHHGGGPQRCTTAWRNTPYRTISPGRSAGRIRERRHACSGRTCESSAPAESPAVPVPERGLPQRLRHTRTVSVGMSALTTACQQGG